MRDGDAFFVHLDGADALADFDGASAAKPASWNLLFSPERVGLAAGLNRLIELVLQEGKYEYLARMDADDESLPGRIQLQRNYLEINRNVGVLGGHCREVDEAGRFIQMKRLESAHDRIVGMLPKRNPMNHPTVMFRRSALEAGLQYRENVRLMEDYHLWVDLAQAGIHFANLEEPLLNFQRDGGFFQRRSGWGQACSEFGVRWHAIRSLHAPVMTNLVYASAAFGLRIMPSGMQALLYRLLR
jgi:glycosyltransferase involved in cell wall biosynthesis